MAISNKAVAEIGSILVDFAKRFTGNSEMLILIAKLKKVKANQSYKKSIEAIEKELRWRFGKDY